MVDANAMDATLARSERLSMYQLRCDAREREVAELEAKFTEAVAKKEELDAERKAGKGDAVGKKGNGKGEEDG